VRVSEIASRLAPLLLGLAACSKASTGKAGATDLGRDTTAPDAERESADGIEDAEEPPSEDVRNPWGRCESPTSTLDFESSGEAMSHDHDTTRTMIRLRTREGREYTHDLEGSVGCLAYSRTRHAYVLGVVGAMAAWRPLFDILYLNDRSGALEASKAVPEWAENKGSWCAFTASSSEDGRFIVFVSDYDSRVRLEVLDTRADCLLRIGRAPLPPPSTWAQENVEEPYDFAWGAGEAGTDGFEGMDPGILEWRGHLLEASYGKDTPSKRARSRTPKRWQMDKLAATCPHR
jgi:hypothetical protein